MANFLRKMIDRLTSKRGESETQAATVEDVTAKKSAEHRGAPAPRGIAAVPVPFDRSDSGSSTPSPEELQGDKLEHQEGLEEGRQALSEEGYELGQDDEALDESRRLLSEEGYELGRDEKAPDEARRLLSEEGYELGENGAVGAEQSGGEEEASTLVNMRTSAPGSSAPSGVEEGATPDEYDEPVEEGDADGDDIDDFSV